MRRSNLRAAVSVTFAVAVAGCAQIVGIEDTELAPIEPGQNLTCVGKVPTPVGDGSDVEIYARIVDITDPTSPVEGMRVVPCASRLQQNCDTSTTYFSDENGEVRVPVQSGYNGYLRIEDPMGDVSPEGWITYFWYFSEPIVETRETPFPISAMRRGFRKDFVYPADNPQDSLLGEIAINATDCGDVNAPGIHFEITTQSSIGDSTIPFYFANGLINLPSMDDPQETDASGLGGYLGVKAGQAGIRAILTATGETVAEDTLLVRPDVLTTVRLLPQ
jgi:hypothetical protein